MAARRKAAPVEQPLLLAPPEREKVRTNEHDRKLHAIWHIVVHRTRTCGPGCGAEAWSPGVSEAEFVAAAGTMGRRWSMLKSWPASTKPLNAHP